MAIGLLSDNVSEQTKQIISRFEEKNRAITCRDILGLDISIASELDKIKQENLFVNVCRPLIFDTAGMLDELIINDR